MESEYFKKMLSEYFKKTLGNTAEKQVQKRGELVMYSDLTQINL